MTVARSTLACYFNLDGPRTAIYEDEHAQFEKAVVVHVQGCAALVVQSRNCTLSMFSLPDLSYIARAKFDTTLQCVFVPLSLSTSRSPTDCASSPAATRPASSRSRPTATTASTSTA